MAYFSFLLTKKTVQLKDTLHILYIVVNARCSCSFPLFSFRDQKMIFCTCLVVLPFSFCSLSLSLYIYVYINLCVDRLQMMEERQNGRQLRSFLAEVLSSVRFRLTVAEVDYLFSFILLPRLTECIAVIIHTYISMSKHEINLFSLHTHAPPSDLNRDLSLTIATCIF